MKGKRILAGLLSAAMLLGLLAGCFGSETDTENVEEDQNIVEQANGYTQIFQKDTILKINIDIEEADWQDMLDNATDEEYHSATVTVNDSYTLENVGVRTKGNSSLSSVARSDSDRYSLRIKFDKYEDQDLLGLDEMVVNNCWSDPSYMREYLTYEALEEIGMDVPLRAYTELYINGELYGFYLGIEAIDDSLLERLFGDNNGNLYKADMQSTLEYSESSDYETLDLKNGDDADKEGLKTFIQTLNDMSEGEKGDIESILDVDSALKYIAGMTALGSYDSYNGNMAQNYYLCQNNGIFTVIPWDYNMSFGGAMDGQGESTTIPIDEPVYGVTMESRPLIDKLLAVPEYLEAYHGYIEQLTDWLEGMEERVTEVADLIRPYVEQDPTKFYTMEQFESAISADSGEDTPESDLEEGIPEVSADETRTVSTAAESATEASESPQQSTAESGRPADPNGNDQGENRQRPGRGGGGDMKGMGKNISILTFAIERRENLRAQLNGELETTGNTTMNNAGPGGGGGGPGGGFPGGGPGGDMAPPEGFSGEMPDEFPGEMPEGMTPPHEMGSSEAAQ